MDEETSHAAWSVYVALHNVAAGHVLGMLPTDVRDDGAALGDIDDLLQQLTQHEAVLDGADPQLVQHVRDAVAHWDSRPATRLIEPFPTWVIGRRLGVGTVLAKR
jgi:hypothetical protein